MKIKTALKNMLQPREEQEQLIAKFNHHWHVYINKEIKRKFLYIVYQNYPQIKAFRKKWNISEEGFRTETQVKRWLEEHIKNTPKGSKGATYWEKIVPYESLGLFLIEKRHREKAITSRKRLGSKATFTDRFQKAAQELAKDIGMDNSWYEQFEDYILFNTEEMRSIINKGIKISKKLKTHEKDKPVEGKVVLEFGPNTRLKDIQFIWRDQVEPIKKQLPGYIDIPPNAKPKKPKEDC